MGVFAKCNKKFVDGRFSEGKMPAVQHRYVRGGGYGERESNLEPQWGRSLWLCGYLLEKGVWMANNDHDTDDARSIASQLDDTDGVILDILENNGRATLSHLSVATGLSVSAVQSRVQKLERRGVIRGYKAIIDDERRGLTVNAYIAVTPTDYSREADIPDKLKDIDGIMSCDSVAGSPSFMLTVRTESPAKLEELLNLIHRTVPVSTETTIVLKRYFSM